MNEYDWLILGGGIHGVHLAARLIGEGGVEGSRLGILDPAPRLLDRWHTFTRATGMSHLRSPGVHHLDLEPFSLIHFAGRRRSRPFGLLRGRYQRPRLDLFNNHCERVIERFGLAALHLREKAAGLEPGAGGVQVTTRSGGRLAAARVILAIGAGSQPHWPAWAPRDEPRVRHIFESDPTTWDVDSGGQRHLVVGGGISGAQVALQLAEQGALIDLITRHPLRIQEFDSDPGWLGPRLMPRFARERCPVGRRRLIQAARHVGSVTPEVRRALRGAVKSGKLKVHEGAVSELQPGGGELRLKLGSGKVITGERLHLATGFARHRPGGRMVDRLAEEFELRCGPCGYPLVDTFLRWHPEIHVSGPLAELELGPVARNIAGARRAGDRLLQGFLRSRGDRLPASPQPRDPERGQRVAQVPNADAVPPSP